MTTRKKIIFAVFMLLSLTLAAALVAGCGNPFAKPTPTPTKTPRPTYTPTPPPPTETPVPPTPTYTPSPTETPLPTPTPTPEVVLIAPASDPAVSPFTGLKPADPAVLERRPLAIKVANTTEVRPQSGLSKADVVIESLVEYSVTRFTVIYQSQDAERVGSIRSARLIDVELPVFFDAVLCFSGGVEPVRQLLYGSDFGDHILEEARNGASFYRDPNIAVPHNLFASTVTLWQTVTKRGWNTRPQPTGAWVFSEKAPEAGTPANKIAIPYPQGTVSWSYDPAVGLWQRFVKGEPLVDALDGKQLTAADIVVLGATHVRTLILEHGTEDVGINRSIEIQLWGQGPLKILRDGKVYEGTWVRSERRAPFRFIDAAGNDIPLKPGNSWWQVVPLDMTVTVENN